MPVETGAVIPNTIHHWNYQAEARPALPDNATQVDISATSWFNALVGQFNRGETMPSNHHNPLHTGDMAENYLSTLVASTLMHLVSEEGGRHEVGVATRFERHILETWADNRLRFHEGGENNLRTKFLEFAEVVALEQALKHAMNRGLNVMGNRMLPNMETKAFETLVATLASKKTIDLAHLNVVAFESYVAINATEVDPTTLYDIMHKTMDIALEKQAEQATNQE